MKITLSYHGKEHGILYPPLTLLALANTLDAYGYDIELVQDDECYEYLGLPGESPSESCYYILKGIVKRLTGEDVNPLYAPINYELCPSYDVPLLVTAYGCAYNCTECPKLEKGKVLLRPRDVVLNELKWITDRHDYFEFGDYNIFLDKKNFFSIIKQIPSGVKWGALINIDNNYSNLALNIIKNYGCVNLYVGVESFNPKDLDYLNKPYYRKGIEPKEFLLHLLELGFNINAYLIRGLPNQTREEWIETTDWLTSHNISYTSNMFINTEGVYVENTEHLTSEYLQSKLTEDFNQTAKNLNKFLAPYTPNRL